MLHLLWSFDHTSLICNTNYNALAQKSFSLVPQNFLVAVLNLEMKARRLLGLTLIGEGGGGGGGVLTTPVPNSLVNAGF